MNTDAWEKENYIQLRSIQQYYYCPKRWGLINVNRDWQENAFVAIGDVLHERVDDNELVTVTKSKITERAVAVFNRKYCLTGKIDALELTPHPKGTYIKKYEGYFDIAVVEYKKARSKSITSYAIDDALQVYGQKLCIDEMLCCDSKMFLYYFNVKKRVQVTANNELKQLFFAIHSEICQSIEKDEIPQKREDQHCGGCSFLDICLPKVYKAKGEIKKIIMEQNEKIT